MYTFVREANLAVLSSIPRLRLISCLRMTAVHPIADDAWTLAFENSALKTVILSKSNSKVKHFGDKQKSDEVCMFRVVWS